MSINHTDTTIQTLNINKFPSKSALEQAIAQGLVGNNDLSFVTGDTSLSDIDDVVVSGVSVGQFLSWDGTNWINTDADFINSGVTSMTHYATSANVVSALNNKVDKINGKGLSTNDYTTEDMTKLAGIASGAEANVQSDWSQTDASADDFIKNKPGLATSASSGFMSSEMAEAVLGLEDKERVIAQSISYIGSRSDIVPMSDTVKTGSDTNVVLGISAVQDTSHVITFNYSESKSVTITINNSGNLATHHILINNVNNFDCNVSFVAYNFDAENIAIGNTIYDSLTMSGSFVGIDYVSGMTVLSNSITEFCLVPYISGNSIGNNTNLMVSVTKHDNIALSSSAYKVDLVTSGDYLTAQLKDYSGLLIGSGNSVHKPTYTASEVSAIPLTQKGANNGVATLDSSGKIPSSQCPVSGVHNGTYWTALTINGVTKSIPSNGGGGLSDYDFIEISAPTLDDNIDYTAYNSTIYFNAGERNCVELSPDKDLYLDIYCYNSSDNYIWITNSNVSDSIDVIFNDISDSNGLVYDVLGTGNIPTLQTGQTLEIGVYVNNTYSKARITSRIL